MNSAPDRELVAYEIYRQSDMPLSPAPYKRDWMERTQMRFAYRCLPLTLANQAGWVIANPSSFTAVWNGGSGVEDVTIQFDRPEGDPRISSLFGHSVITFNMPYLFRTPPGINLWVKGPSNQFKDGVAPLEGIVETDWTHASFTMNWKLTRPGLEVRFEQGESICMVLPQQRGLLESLEPLRTSLDAEPEVANGYRRWSAERDAYHQRVAAGDKEAVEVGWQKDYFQGRDPGQGKFDSHQTRLGVRPFQEKRLKEV